MDDNEENHPPRPDVRRERESRERRPWKEVELQRVDVDAARREARVLVANVRGLWGLGAMTSSSISTLPASPTSPREHEARDTRRVLATTAQSIRRIRTLALTILHTTQYGSGGRRVSETTLHPPRPSRTRSSFSSPSRPGSLSRAVSLGVPEYKSSHAPVAGDDVMADLRKADLEVLAGLRGLEERLRIQRDTTKDEDSQINIDRPSSSVEAASQSCASAPDMDFTGLTFTRPSSAASTAYSQSENYFEEEDEHSVNSLAHTGEVQHVQTWEDRIISEDRYYRNLQEEEEREQGVRESVRRCVMISEKIFLVGTVEEDGGVEEWAIETWEGRTLGWAIVSR